MSDQAATVTVVLTTDEAEAVLAELGDWHRGGVFNPACDTCAALRKLRLALQQAWPLRIVASAQAPASPSATG